VFKPMIGKAEDPIIRRRIGRKQTQMVYSRDKRTKTIETKEADQIKRCFSDEDSKILAKWCLDIENHYSAKHGHSTPMDIGTSPALTLCMALCILQLTSSCVAMCRMGKGWSYRRALHCPGSPGNGEIAPEERLAHECFGRWPRSRGNRGCRHWYVDFLVLP